MTGWPSYALIVTSALARDSVFPVLELEFPVLELEFPVLGIGPRRFFSETLESLVFKSKMKLYKTSKKDGLPQMGARRASE